MKARHDYYKILHVAPDAPDAIVRSSYRTLMQQLKLHPDLGGDHETASLINQAFAVLKDPKKRAQYDRQRQVKNRTAKPKPPSRRPAAAQSRKKSPVANCLFCNSPHNFGPNVEKDAQCSSCKSPLTSVEQYKSQEDGSRALSRVTKQHPITFYTGWPASRPHAGESRDVSLNGMKFLTAQAVPREQILKIECDIFSAVARVAHTQAAGNSWIIGVEFVALNFEKTQGTFVSLQA